MPRREIIELLNRRVRALGAVGQTIRIGDPSIVLHRLGQMPCMMAVSGVKKYLQAARTQMGRIEAARHATDSSVFHEIHYYFICWDAVWKRLNLIKKRSGFSSLKRLLQKYQARAEHYQCGRDQLEHYDERLDGRPKLPSLTAWDWGILSGTTYTLAGQQWDVSRASLERLERLVHEFGETVMMEGCQKLMVQEMNRPKGAGQ